MFSKISRYINIALLLALTGVAFGWRASGKLPPRTKLRNELFSDPQQRITAKKPFSFNYYDKEYRIFPRADYRLYGVVVSHNNPTGFGDIYHDHSSVDIRDLCLIWGDNLLLPGLNRISFWSESFTCNYRISDSRTWEEFRGDQFANNHLLALTPAVRKRIREVRVGDQIGLTGTLIDYAPVEEPDLLRKTSLVREDNGNGACEVLLVDQVEILARATPSWYALYERSLQLLVLLLVLRVVTWLIFPYLEYRFG